MASLVNDPDGRRRILFKAADGSRKPIRLGKMSRRDAEAICRHVEALVASKESGQPLTRETAVWLREIGSTLHGRLARVGLVEPRSTSTGVKLAPFIDTLIAGRVDAKPGTIRNLTQARDHLLAHFGQGRTIQNITAGDADGYRLHLLGLNLAENTVRRLCGGARQFFRAAVRRELIARNPFEGVPCTMRGNPARQRFITQADIAKVLDECPDAEWRLIVALSRYGGLRCPSEHRMLRWSDIAWDKGTMLVTSTKTERYEGRGTRIVPIFAELRPYLLDAFEQAEPGAEYATPRCRDKRVNLRTAFKRIVERAGLDMWPKPFHNLRASRETELADEFPEHVVCRWIGNSRRVATDHYFQVTADHVAKAIAGGGRAKKAAQNPAQQAHAVARNDSQQPVGAKQNPAKCGALRNDASHCDSKSYRSKYMQNSNGCGRMRMASTSLSIL
ncbi:MAG: hypothetical protein BIFFINMI_02695 [Phycisphaerae bacterium]|nr:hypothetical protein [Phycisphaerae bacterium]